MVLGAISGVNVGDCDGTQCGHSVCQNGASCLPLSDGIKYTCTCTEVIESLVILAPEHIINQQVHNSHEDDEVLPFKPVAASYSCKY